MTDKTKMSNLESYTELSIQIATLDLKLDKILELLNTAVPEDYSTHPLNTEFMSDDEIFLEENK